MHLFLEYFLMDFKSALLVCDFKHTKFIAGFKKLAKHRQKSGEEVAARVERRVAAGTADERDGVSGGPQVRDSPPVVLTAFCGTLSIR